MASVFNNNQLENGKCSIKICHQLFLENGIHVKISYWINASLIGKKKYSKANTNYFIVQNVKIILSKKVMLQLTHVSRKAI